MAEMNGVLREFTKSKEMAFAWAFRLMLMLVIALSGIAGRLAWQKLDAVEKQGVVSAAEFTKLNVAVQSAFARYDETKILRDQQVQGITTELGDHETRIRALERPH
ncbi:MAG TPA: hypothetical protein VFW44_13685 [Bryobacteraceae bacterium]|nr:hypothetical protein [Bryobacteraceae bacterium]